MSNEKEILGRIEIEEEPAFLESMEAEEVRYFTLAGEEVDENGHRK